jgi:hypothetical protein
MAGNSRVWEIRIGLFATKEQVSRISEEIQNILTADSMPRVPGIPWTLATFSGDAISEGSYDDLVRQYEVERGIASDAE